jgi:hypothetical protein
MTTKEKFEWALASLTSSSTRFRPKNSELVDNGLMVAELYTETAADHRQIVANEISLDLRKKMLTISGFMAEEALNTKDPKWIRGAILLHVIDDFSGDYRENFRYLALVNYAAEKIGVKITDVVGSIMVFASNRTFKCLEDFFHRDESLNHLSSFGIIEKVVDGVSTFVPKA